MAKKDWKETMTPWLILISFAALLFLFVIIMAYFGYESNKKDCENYYSYGYQTELVGGFWDYFRGGGLCLITMEDGTKLPLRDYKTFAIKNAKVRT